VLRPCAKQRQTQENERRSDAAAHPLVRAVLSKFPGAEIVGVRERAPEPVEVPPRRWPWSRATMRHDAVLVTPGPRS
jgi:hypothetical protein